MKHTNRKKTDAKTYSLKRRKRRQTLAFIRMCRYGINNFSRNTWLTLAATAMMTLTLFVIFVSVAARNVLVDSVAQIRKQVDMSLYVKSDTPRSVIAAMEKTLKQTPGVASVRYRTPTQARDDYRDSNRNDVRALEALAIADLTFPGVFHVNLEDTNNIGPLNDYADKNQTYRRYAHPDLKPSFDQSNRGRAIQTIGRWAGFAEKLGMVASVTLVIIASLIVFNTIRMAIFNRRDEIEMMKLIGADKSFIRGPFVVEAVVYGFIAAIIATVLGVTLLVMAEPKLSTYGIAVQPTLHIVSIYGILVVLVMVAVGALIGIVSSLLATQRYLKI